MDELLKYILEQSKANIGPNHPHGFCYVPAGTDVSELVNSELVQAQVTARAQDGSFPVRLTEAGVNRANAPKQPETHFPALQARPEAGVVIEHGIAIPDKKTFGRTSNGDDNVTRWKFDDMEINASFFIPQDKTKDVAIHRTFSSVVSQANKKLWPKNFVIREWEGGARVWRIENLTEQRPTRPRKVATKPQPVTAAATGPQFPGGFAAPGNTEFGGAPFAPSPQAFPGFPDQGGFAGPQGFGEQTWGEPGQE